MAVVLFDLFHILLLIMSVDAEKNSFLHKIENKFKLLHSQRLLIKLEFIFQMYKNHIKGCIMKRFP